MVGKVEKDDISPVRARRVEMESQTINGYKIRWNELWKTWQVSHPEIAAIVEEFDTRAEAVEYCEHQRCLTVA